MKDVVNNHGEVDGNYVSRFKENQLLKIEAIKTYFSLDKSPLSHVKPVTEPNVSWQEMQDKAVTLGENAHHQIIMEYVMNIGKNLYIKANESS